MFTTVSLDVHEGSSHALNVRNERHKSGPSHSVQVSPALI